MQLEHVFTVPIGADEAFRVLRDIERVGPCMPGATIDDVDGDEFSGRVNVKVGPMKAAYRGTARFVDVDEAGHRATIEARGVEQRGGGTARATVTAALRDAGDGTTEVTVTTDLAVTGRPAQFGRGVMADVGEKLLGQFADCLAGELGATPREVTAEAEVPTVAAAQPGAEAPAPEPAGAPGTGAPPPAARGDAARLAASQPAPRAPGGAGRDGRAEPRPATARRVDDEIDLLEVAGAPVLKRVAPVVLLLVLAGVVAWIARRATGR